MDLRTARHLVSLAEHLNFTRAANEVHLTQSALSRSIQQVEASLGVKLFDRDRTKVELTALGRTVVDGAVQLLKQAREFDDVLDSLKNGAQASVSFGMARTAAAALLPQVLEVEMAAWPGRQNKVVVRSFNSLMDVLLTRDIEFFVSAEHARARPSIVHADGIAKFPMAQLVRAGHPLLRGGEQRRQNEFPWMISSTDAPAPNAADMGYPHLREAPEIVLEDLGCAARLTETTDVIWLTSTLSATRELSDGRLRRLPFPKQVPAGASYQLMIYRLKDRTLSPAAERLCQLFRDLALRLRQGV